MRILLVKNHHTNSGFINFPRLHDLPLLAMAIHADYFFPEIILQKRHCPIYVVRILGLVLLHGTVQRDPSEIAFQPFINVITLELTFG